LALIIGPGILTYYELEGVMAQAAENLDDDFIDE
jgi:hypothetical protein